MEHGALTGNMAGYRMALAFASALIGAERGSSSTMLPLTSVTVTTDFPVEFHVTPMWVQFGVNTTCTKSYTEIA